VAAVADIAQLYEAAALKQLQLDIFARLKQNAVDASKAGNWVDEAKAACDNRLAAVQLNWDLASALAVHITHEARSHRGRLLALFF
jgi:C4-dicarboxylate-specific signal transduction histidine kinase